VDIAELFRREVLFTFVEKELITESVVENIISWPHSEFHVHLGPVIRGDDKEQLRVTARYGARAPLALKRLTYNREKEQVSYAYTNPYDHAGYTKKITTHELLRVVFEVSLTCPRCGNEMKRCSFITEREPIRQILIICFDEV